MTWLARDELSQESPHLASYFPFTVCIRLRRNVIQAQTFPRLDGAYGQECDADLNRLQLGLL